MAVAIQHTRVAAAGTDATGSCGTDERDWSACSDDDTPLTSQPNNCRAVLACSSLSMLQPQRRVTCQHCRVSPDQTLHCIAGGPSQIKFKSYLRGQSKLT